MKTWKTIYIPIIIWFSFIKKLIAAVKFSIIKTIWSYTQSRDGHRCFLSSREHELKRTIFAFIGHMKIISTLLVKNLLIMAKNDSSTAKAQKRCWWDTHLSIQETQLERFSAFLLSRASTPVTVQNANIQWWFQQMCNDRMKCKRSDVCRVRDLRCNGKLGRKMQKRTTCILKGYAVFGFSNVFWSHNVQGICECEASRCLTTLL